MTQVAQAPLLQRYKSVFLCLLYSAYLLLGAVGFMYLEFEDVTETYNQPTEDLQIFLETWEDHKNVTWLELSCPSISSEFISSLGNSSELTDEEMLQQLEIECPELHVLTDRLVRDFYWSYIDSLYFTMTVATTIGYGHMSPTTAGGRIYCMLYAVLGIPLTGILLAWTSEFYAQHLFKVFKSKLSKEKQMKQAYIAAASFVSLSVGFIVFIFIPAGVFVWTEDWSYLDAVYYAFITLTTIGFGDFVSGSSTPEGGPKEIYHLVVILWVMTGLGYWVMIANFLTKTLNSKELHKSLARRAHNMKNMVKQMSHQGNDTFIPQQSKSAFNFVLQLSQLMADVGSNDDLNSIMTSPNSPAGQQLQVIPGIEALFSGMARNRAIGGNFAALLQDGASKSDASVTDDASSSCESSPPLLKESLTISPESAEAHINSPTIDTSENTNL